MSERRRERKDRRRAGESPPALFHVTSSRNRESIRAHGLDWQRMQFARGIAGSVRPEQEGCFLCLDQWEVDWFVDMNNTGGTVDVWAVEGVSREALVVSPEGHHYVPGIVSRDQLKLVRSDIPPRDCEDSSSTGADGALTVRVKFEPRDPTSP